MRKSVLRFIAVSTLFTETSAQAGEAELLRFDALHARGLRTTNPEIPLEDSLRPDFLALSAQKEGKRIGNWVAKLQCSTARYVPTWWLPAEVETRRATYFEAISEIACENGLPANLLDAVVAQESGYKAWAISSAGAMGMMQIMPGTARNLQLRNPWNARSRPSTWCNLVGGLGSSSGGFGGDV